MIRAWNSALVFNRQARGLFYKVLAAQLSAGLSLNRSLASLADTEGLPPAIEKVASKCRDLVAAGQGIAVGLEESRSVPLDEVAYIDAAEGRNALPELLAELASGAEDKEASLASAFTGNLRHLLTFAFLFAVYYAAAGPLESYAEFNPAILDQPLADAVRVVSGYGPALALLLAAVIAAAAWCRKNLVGRARLALPAIGKEWERLVALRFCRLAALMLPRRVSHAELVSLARTAMPGRFARAAIEEAEARLGEGQGLAAALDGTILDPSTRAIVESLAPGGDPAAYPKAFEAAGEILAAVQQRFYARFKAAVTLALLVVIAAGGITLLAGILISSTQLQSAIRP